MDIKTPFSHVFPGLSTLLNPDKNKRDFFPDKRPNGIVIHYTADRDEVRAQKSLDERGLAYHLVIHRSGVIVQHAWLDRQAWHAGKAWWRGFSPNVRFLGIALVSWGELKHEHDPAAFVSWNGTPIPKEEVSFRRGNVNAEGYYWDSATDAQMAALNNICLWAMANGIPVENICGHDECATPIGRKIDPGGVLPMTMLNYRQFLAMDMLKLS